MLEENTKKRKKSIAGMKEVYGKEEMVSEMYRILATGKQGFDTLMRELGRMVVEAIMYIEREEIAGPDYQPTNPGIYKWASQPGSVYIGDQKIKVEHPRLRNKDGEILLQSLPETNTQKNQNNFQSVSYGLKILNGISCQKYQETIIDTAQASSISLFSIPAYH